MLVKMKETFRGCHVQLDALLTWAIAVDEHFIMLHHVRQRLRHVSRHFLR